MVLDKHMKYIFLVAFVIFSNNSFSCERKTPIKAEAMRSADGVFLLITIEAPTLYENYRLSNSIYPRRGGNCINCKNDT